MGLPPELQRYAENVWQRFPEEFLALGAPHLEDFFELHEAGVWYHRIVDTKSEKVIEIVLPRRKVHDEEQEEQLEHDEEDLEVAALGQLEPSPRSSFEGSTLRQPQPKVGQLAAAGAIRKADNSQRLPRSLADEDNLIAQRLAQLHRQIGSISEHISHSVSREVSARLMRDPKDGRHSEPSHTPPSAASLQSSQSLSQRRGLTLTPVWTKELRKTEPGSVQRVPMLDRSASGNSLASAGPAMISRQRQASFMSNSGSEASKELSTGFYSESCEDSPGARIQRFAASVGRGSVPKER
eukprot:gnl/TRDRNA2_/TRDRNA2_66047_c0_seq1.p1 gnl/TRDRNA2_/TRDRNA2_66047_c0~~gnl/TRDRNA2_/TRDRNA2_66047_c0_seq1.p1  ORF type:complete len:296 (+),score=53.91 gnl/TRDRNA2_/TRDRNA2_66047_c0_seq1:71-958(+)